MDNKTYSSMYHDLVNQKRLEIEAFSGTVIRYGKERGVQTPVHQEIYDGLLPYHLEHTRQR
jgi:ketopantoate reductase